MEKIKPTNQSVNHWLIVFSSGTTERSEGGKDRQDVYELLSSTANGTSLLSEETMALLNYIDYEQKRILASRGKLSCLR